MNRSLGRFRFPLVIAAALIATSCSTSGKRMAKKTSGPGSETAGDSTYIPGVDVSEANLRGGEFSSAEGLSPIYFDYDSSTLKPAALENLKSNAEHLKQQNGLEVLVAGYCDDRGTIEYNLALGQKRAKEVREYYIRLGVPGKAIATISYGKESPFCADATEECWGSNRRAETRIRSSTASLRTPSESAQ